jgi:hypothetical protein
MISKDRVELEGPTLILHARQPRILRLALKSKTHWTLSTCKLALEKKNYIKKGVIPGRLPNLASHCSLMSVDTFGVTLSPSASKIVSIKFCISLAGLRLLLHGVYSFEELATTAAGNLENFISWNGFISNSSSDSDSNLVILLRSVKSHKNRLAH